MIHRVWPQFQLTRKDGGFAMSGIPREHLRAELSRAFLNDATCKKWQDRQAKILFSELTTHQQDYFLQSLLLRARSNEERQLLAKNNRARVSPLSGVIFPVLFQADTGEMRILLRTIAGLEDFARTSAHHPHRKIHPDLSNDRLK